jgi:hypothetical protein
MLVYRVLSSVAAFLIGIIAAYYGAFVVATLLPSIGIWLAFGPNRRKTGKLARARWATIRKKGPTLFVVGRSVGVSALMVLYSLCLRYAFQPNVEVLRDSLSKSKWLIVVVILVAVAFCGWDWRRQEKEFSKWESVEREAGAQGSRS